MPNPTPTFAALPFATFNTKSLVSPTMVNARFQLPVFTPAPTPPFAQSFRAVSRRIVSLAFAMPLFASAPTPASLRVVTVRGDGRCLYRAIAKNLASLEGRKLSERLERADADALRNIAWKAICIDRSKEFVANHVIEGSLSAYCAQMRNPAFYGGEAEMLALSDVLKQPIKVYLKADRGQLRNIVTYGERYISKRKAASRGKRDHVIRVLYMNGNHYDALLPR